MGVASGRSASERSFLDRIWVVAGTSVPEEDLACVGTADNERRMERGESRSKYIRGAVKGVFWTGM